MIDARVVDGVITEGGVGEVIAIPVEREGEVVILGIFFGDLVRGQGDTGLLLTVTEADVGGESDPDVGPKVILLAGIDVSGEG